jgi:hypothetical protein
LSSLLDAVSDAIQKDLIATASKNPLIFNEFVQAAAKSIDPKITRTIHGLSGGYSLLLTPDSTSFVDMVTLQFVCSQVPKLRSKSFAQTLSADDVCRMISSPDPSLHRFDPATCSIFSCVRSNIVSVSSSDAANLALLFSQLRNAVIDMSQADWAASSFSGPTHAQTLFITNDTASILAYPAMFGIEGERKSLHTSSAT